MTALLYLVLQKKEKDKDVADNNRSIEKSNQELQLLIRECEGGEKRRLFYVLLMVPFKTSISSESDF